MPESHTDIVVLVGGKPVQLGNRTEQMVVAIVEKRNEIEALRSGRVELDYGPSEVQGFIREKLGFWKVG